MVAGTGVSGNGSNQLNQPRGVFVMDDGTMYIADSFNHRIQKWTIGARSDVTVAGTGSAGRGLSELYYPLKV
jgi:sugar lactone lactonase YvrE